MSSDDPVVAHVVRNGFVESVHHGRVVGLDATGSIAFASGDVHARVLPRSSLKPMQAQALLDAGWHPGDEAQIALAAGSHSGAELHVNVVRRMLSAAGLEESALQNTPDLPLDTAAAHALIRAGGCQKAAVRGKSDRRDPAVMRLPLPLRFLRGDVP